MMQNAAESFWQAITKHYSTNPVDSQGFAVTFLRHLCAFPNSNPVGCCFANFFAAQRNAKSNTPISLPKSKKQELARPQWPFQPLFQQYFPILRAILPRKAWKNLSCLGRQKRLLSWCARRDLNPYVINTRPSNVPVCQFQHSRSTSDIIATNRQIVKTIL